MITQKEKIKFKNDLERYAKESLEIEFTHVALHAYGSELATLRILKAHRYSYDARAEYSDEHKKHFFSMNI